MKRDIMQSEKNKLAFGLDSEKKLINDKANKFLNPKDSKITITPTIHQKEYVGSKVLK